MMDVNQTLFIEWLNGRCAIGVKTQEEYEKLMLFIQQNTNLRWSSENIVPTKTKSWIYYGNLTCVYVMKNAIWFGDVKFCIHKGFDIIEIDQLFLTYEHNSDIGERITIEMLIEKLQTKLNEYRDIEKEIAHVKSFDASTILLSDEELDMIIKMKHDKLDKIRQETSEIIDNSCIEFYSTENKEKRSVLAFKSTTRIIINGCYNLDIVKTNNGACIIHEFYISKNRSKNLYNYDRRSFLIGCAGLNLSENESKFVKTKAEFKDMVLIGSIFTHGNQMEHYLKYGKKVIIKVQNEEGKVYTI